MANSITPDVSVPQRKRSDSSLTTDDRGQNDGAGDTPTTQQEEEEAARVKAIKRKVDWRLCPIAGILCSLELVDSNIISSASVTTMFEDLDLYGNRYSVVIFIFTISIIVFQLPATAASRWLGPRLWFSSITIAFGLITICTAFSQSWKSMIALRVLLGIAMAGIFPGTAYIISTYYTRREQQLRFAFVQVVQIFIMATGGILNFGLQHLHGRGGLAGWRWMFLVQGAITCVLGIITWFWMVDFPEYADRSIKFLSTEETACLVRTINKDRNDVEATSFTWRKLLKNWDDPKIYLFSCMWFIQNTVSTAVSYFLPIILKNGLGFDPNRSILLAQPPYYWALIPTLLSSWVGDRLRLRGPIIAFNATCMIVGFSMLGFTSAGAVRYLGTFFVAGAYVSNWAALNAYCSNNITGQWKRVFTAAVVNAFKSAGGIGGSFLLKENEAPQYLTAVWVVIGLHLLMIGIVIVFTIVFYFSNKAQKNGKKIIEATPGFRFMY
ncbi:MAG: hypothetical protein M1831_000663 [Alyxoria varia]|nr:MAG: hypothetical protein M1831_000663 [Alyxoria varia]